MAFLIKDRVLETCSSPGTGAATLLGAVTGYQSFSTAFSSTNGTTTYYCIADQGGANWEVGLGTWNTGNTLTRTTVIASSNAGTTVNFASGTQNIFCTYPAEYAVYIDPTTSNVSLTTLSTTGDITMSGTGEIKVATGTTAQRSGSPTTGMFRYNSTLNQFEGYNGSIWGGIGGAQAGGAIQINNTTASVSYTVATGTNGFSVGPITTASGVSITVASGQRWVII